MSDVNPFRTPVTATEVSESDVLKMQKVARQFNLFRQQPPTVWGQLMKPSGLPLKLLIASTMFLLLMWVASNPNSGITVHWAVAAIAFYAGALSRDFVQAYRLARWWPANIYFIDWDRVAQYDPTSSTE